jgi:hypothetical protein
MNHLMPHRGNALNDRVPDPAARAGDEGNWTSVSSHGDELAISFGLERA